MDVCLDGQRKKKVPWRSFNKGLGHVDWLQRPSQPKLRDLLPRKLEATGEKMTSVQRIGPELGTVGYRGADLPVIRRVVGCGLFASGEIGGVQYQLTKSSCTRTSTRYETRDTSGRF